MLLVVAVSIALSLTFLLLLSFLCVCELYPFPSKLMLDISRTRVGLTNLGMPGIAGMFLDDVADEGLVNFGDTSFVMVLSRLAISPECLFVSVDGCC